MTQLELFLMAELERIRESTRQGTSRELASVRGRIARTMLDANQLIKVREAATKSLEKGR